MLAQTAAAILAKRNTPFFSCEFNALYIGLSAGRRSSRDNAPRMHPAQPEGGASALLRGLQDRRRADGPLPVYRPRSRDLDQQLPEVPALKQAEERGWRIFQAFGHILAIFEAAAAHPFADFA